MRLSLGYSAFLLAAACFAWDYKLGFESTKYYTAAAVALYGILNRALTYWIWAVEKRTVYVGTAPSGDKVYICVAKLRCREIPVADKKSSPSTGIHRLSHDKECADLLPHHHHHAQEVSQARRGHPLGSLYRMV